MSKLANLRQTLRNLKIDAFIIPTKDAHNSEYIASRDKRREFISGFSGSAGTAVVTMERALLWVDPRYWLAAELQTDRNFWEIVRMGQKNAPSLTEWLSENLSEDSVLGFDPFLTSAREHKTWKHKLRKIRVRAVPKNPVDLIWDEQPKYPVEKIFVHTLKYSGKDAKTKIRELKLQLAKSGCFACAVTSLDEIAWLLNLRGNDIEFNPVFISYCIVSSSKTTLFVDPEKLDEKTKQYLQTELEIEIKNYEDIEKELRSVGEIARTKKLKISVSPDQCNQALCAILSGIDSNLIFEQRSPVELSKAVKNDVEIDGMINSHIRDGAAKTAWMAWLEEAMAEKDLKLTEIDVADKLEFFRSRQKDFKGLSFNSISAVGKNGAIIHYQPTPQNNSEMDRSKLYLIDSGAQYLDGTTDVTRTMHFERPTEEEVRQFTLVLKGHIALARAVFPEGLSGSMLDVLARQHLWKRGQNYGHGTGHGVGSFLNVHEGPQSISVSKKPSIGLKAGMVLSNEPGFYKKDCFGIRIESVIVVKKATFEGFLEFETVTMVPIQTKMVDVSLLDDGEKEWLNAYHQKCLAKLRPLLEDDERALRFLESSCALIE